MNRFFDPHQDDLPPPEPRAELTLAQLCQVMPHRPATELGIYLPPMLAGMTEFEIIGPRREAAFLAEVAEESGELRWWEELPHRRAFDWCSLCRKLGHGHPAGEQYEGRKDLGNTEPGDGVRYRGRSPLELTGRANYRAVGKALGVDLERSPDLAASPAVGFRVAGYFWRSHGLNELADAGDILAIGRVINVGSSHTRRIPNGEATREAYWARAKKALGVAG